MQEYKIKVVCSDIDGTLIEGGDPANYPAEIKQSVQRLRNEGRFFSMASGRDYRFMRDLWGRLTQAFEMTAGEALLYEDSCVSSEGKKYILAGLDTQTLKLIDEIESQYPSVFEGMVKLPDDAFTIRTARVTREFASGQRTEGTVREKLQKRYAQIKSLFDELRSNPDYASHLQNLSVRMSADAVDFVANNANKGVAFKRYLEILRRHSIYGQNIAVIGDAANDEEILISVLESGGTAGFVGSNEMLEEKLRAVPSGRLIIPPQKGPLGTVEILKYF